MFDDVVIPKYETNGSAGCDIRAYLKDKTDVVLKPEETKIITTGITLAVPNNFVLDVRPRSGLSAKTKMRIANAPGTIDSDFRAECGIIVDNIGKEDIVINHGDRIAQFIFLPVYQANFIKKTELNKTKRTGGFGSTGKN